MPKAKPQASEWPKDPATGVEFPACPGCKQPLQDLTTRFYTPSVPDTEVRTIVVVSHVTCRYLISTTVIPKSRTNPTDALNGLAPEVRTEFLSKIAERVFPQTPIPNSPATSTPLCQFCHTNPVAVTWKDPRSMPAAPAVSSCLDCFMIHHHV